MTRSDLSDEALVAFLREHLEIRDSVASMALAVENAGGDLGEADAAEERLVEEMRHLGRAALQGCALKRVVATEEDIRRQPAVRRRGKKTPLAQEIRRHRSIGAAVAARQRARAPIRERREGQSIGLLASLATGDRGFFRRPALCASPDETAGTLWRGDR